MTDEQINKGFAFSLSFYNSIEFSAKEEKVTYCLSSTIVRRYTTSMRQHTVSKAPANFLPPLNPRAM